jgi:hypothetical protein
MRPGLDVRKLEIDPRLMALASNFFWPHPDDPEFAVNIFVWLSRAVPPGQARGSAFLAYRRDGTVERHELLPGAAIAVEAQGCVHGREPLVAGEHVALPSICANS